MSKMHGRVKTSCVIEAPCWRHSESVARLGGRDQAEPIIMCHQASPLDNKVKEVMARFLMSPLGVHG
jgi:hypothetical protein